MTKWRVLITCPQLQRTIDHYREVFSQNGIEIEVPPVVQQMSEPELLEVIDRFDGVVAGDDPFTAKVLQKGKRLKVIAKWGVGVDAIDSEAARQLGISVSNTPAVFGDDVADVVMGYIILLARQLHKLDQSVRSGSWLKIQGISLSGKSLGVIGIGSIGRAVVRRAVVSGMSVTGCDVIPVPDSFLKDTRIHITGLTELLQSVDFISLNCSLTAATRHMLGHREFAMMKKGVYIVNTSRGALVDEAALIQALHQGKVAGTALDVFESEPLPLDSPLRQFDNCIFGTHNSSNTAEAVLRVNELVIRNLLEGLRTTRP